MKMHISYEIIHSTEGHLMSLLCLRSFVLIKALTYFPMDNCCFIPVNIRGNKITFKFNFVRNLENPWMYKKSEVWTNKMLLL